MADKDGTVSASELARLMNLESARRVQQLVADEGMPRRVQNGRPEYPWPDALKWYIAFKVSAEAAKADPIDLEKARARKMAADAELAELELARVRGEQVPVETFRETVGAIATKIRAQLLAAPGRYSARIVGVDSLPDAQRHLDAIVRDVLNELSEG